MTLSIAVARRNSLLSSYATPFDAGYIKLYAGTVPASADASIGAAVLLGTLTFGSPAFASPSAGSMTANAITQDAAADATGVATFFRSFQSDGTTVIEQGAVTDNPDAWVGSTAYLLGDRVKNGGNIYQCTAPGTSAASGGPTGTGGAITDNTVTWAYQSPVGELTLNTTQIVEDGPIQVSSCIRYM